MLNIQQFDAVFGGARRDEEKSRAKERIYSFRDKNHRWDPKIKDQNYGISITEDTLKVSLLGIPIIKLDRT